MTDKERVRAAADGQWADILSALTGHSIEVFNGRNQPCPKCGGVDRFRFTDQDGCGSCICNQCAKCGDGFATLMWLNDITFREALERVASRFGIHLGRANGRPPGKWPRDLIALNNRELGIKKFCSIRYGIDPEQVRRTRSCYAKYRMNYCYVFSGYNAKLEESMGIAYPVTDKYLRIRTRSGIDKRKTQIVWGTGDAMIIVGSVQQLRDASEVWKCEGATDALALAATLPGGSVAIANMCGAGSFPAGWEALLRDKRVWVVGDHDANRTGQLGAYKAAGLIQV